MRILVVEDEAKMLDLLRDGLREHGHTVMTSRDGADGLELADRHPFDVILLDLMLPKLSGWLVMRELRRTKNPASVLMLTACDGEPEVIAGLEAGADDYLTKPFSFLELLARIKGLARAKAAVANSMFCVDTLVLDCSRHVASRAGQYLDLTRTEFALLQCLLKSGGTTVTRAALVQSVWGEDSAIGRSTLDSFINLLRKKVDLPPERKLVYTVKGVGYCLRIQEGDVNERGGEFA
jgi:DNA-binding response OmpR family regulator